MNEGAKNILNKLNDIEFIEKLSAFVASETKGTISVCFPILENQKDKIHFLIDFKKEPTLFEFSGLSVKIKEKLNYDLDIDNDEDEYLSILNKQLFKAEKIEEFFTDITPLSQENFTNIQMFLNKNYPELFKTKEIEKPLFVSFIKLLKLHEERYRKLEEEFKIMHGQMKEMQYLLQMKQKEEGSPVKTSQNFFQERRSTSPSSTL